MENREKPPNRYSPDIGKTSKYPIANHVSTEKLYELLKAFVHQLSAIHIPTKVAIKEEMKALEKNQTSTLEILPQGKRTVGYYDETFAPVAKLNIIRVLLSLATNLE
ncbi:hypothetical protein Prudu_361S000500 [Prunus dulcis]|uniref:Uncharacterized protein n=1 Tax=Prunus dulcis TaxID=3755 RepID=A0A5H2Y5J7_PRUDU|nr:hypothetical protein Prudu_361S000500 [Prunus dulcis]